MSQMQLQRSSMMTFQVKTLSPLMKVSSNDKRIFVLPQNIGLEVCVDDVLFFFVCHQI